MWKHLSPEMLRFPLGAEWLPCAPGAMSQTVSSPELPRNNIRKRGGSNRMDVEGTSISPQYLQPCPQSLQQRPCLHSFPLPVTPQTHLWEPARCWMRDTDDCVFLKTAFTLTEHGPQTGLASVLQFYLTILSHLIGTTTLGGKHPLYSCFRGDYI